MNEVIALRQNENEKISQIMSRLTLKLQEMYDQYTTNNQQQVAHT